MAIAKNWAQENWSPGDWKKLRREMPLAAAVFEKVRSLHTYDTPELIALPIEQGSADYLNWMDEIIKA